MKILVLLLSLVQIPSTNASLVAVMDSGTDISHKDLATKVWINKNEKAGSLKDLDNDGLPGDINGWDFTENSPKVFNDKYVSLINEDVKKFFNYYSLFELGKIGRNSQEFSWLKIASSDNVFMNKINFLGGYIHGTHVAGISVLKNDKAKILTFKIIPTVFNDYKKTKEVPLKDNRKLKAAEGTAVKTIEEFSADIVKGANEQVEEMLKLHSIIAFHKVDVVNQSFGVGHNDIKNYIKTDFIKELKRSPTDAEVDALVKVFFNQILKEGPRMFNVAPNTLFAIAAGNDSLDNDLYSDFPSNIQAENKIVVAATFGYKSLADFSNYGATKVDVAAPGVAITSTAPVNNYISLSGTSQATPLVTNIIATMKDINKQLTVRDLKAIVLGTVDVKSWLKGKVKTSGIVNFARAIKAAEISTVKTVDLAISEARAVIADVAIEKSFSLRTKNMTIDFKPIRPSLIIQKSEF